MVPEAESLDEVRRRIAALWDPPSAGTRGRPAKVTRAQVVDAAIVLADAQGLEATSMRAVARELDVGAMTLYTHVGSQRELLDAMIDRAYADFRFADDDAPWREALEQHARGLWQLFRRHPWLARVNSWRLPLGPHVIDVEEAGFRTLVDTGLSARQVTEVLGVVQNFVVGLAGSVAAEEADARDQGVDYEQYWRSTAEFWEKYFDSERYPTMTRLWTAGAFETAPGPHDVTLDGLLDTVALSVERALADGGTPIPSYDECMATYRENVARQVKEFES
ncbi:MAG: TetR/AcrR family transcriptional regulator [Gordonia sp. (in: high G+C Gram-positive bacteria)]|uniref:TetR/AcrR family transcriptional regulator n=1 Tax=Gordonia sp. (in: high G+C Gram-positive bacteria) TaxID=84139 RepID=UPI0039E2E3A3